MTAAVTATRTGRTPARASQWLAAILLPIGPAAIAVLRLIVPYNTTDDAETVVRKVAADPGAQSLAVWMGFVGVLTLVPAVLWVARLTRRAAPRTTALALVLLVPAYLSLGMLVAGDAALLFGVQERLDPAVLARLYEAPHPTTAIVGVLFVVGHVLGTVLLGLAMWQSRAVPRWAAVLTMIAQPLHFVAAVILASHSLDLLAWGLNAVGFAVAGLAVLRQPGDQWER